MNIIVQYNKIGAMLTFVNIDWLTNGLTNGLTSIIHFKLMIKITFQFFQKLLVYKLLSLKNAIILIKLFLSYSNMHTDYFFEVS